LSHSIYNKKNRFPHVMQENGQQLIAYWNSVTKYYFMFFLFETNTAMIQTKLAIIYNGVTITSRVAKSAKSSHPSERLKLEYRKAAHPNT
jgi:L-asparaginase/Glu-tRNA(Gln) amidotransferase subunit D